MNKKVQSVLEYDKIKNILEKYAVSKLGREMIIKLRPQTEPQIIKRLQQETSEGLAILKSGIKMPIQGIKDIRKSLNLAKVGAVLSPGELLDIASTIKTARFVKSVWQENRLEGIEIISDIIKNIHSFKSLEEKIEKAIISESEISDNASGTLYNIRRKKKLLSQKIRDKLNDIIASPHFQKFLQDPIVTVRQDRFVVPVKQEFRSSFPGVIHDQSTSGATLYIEPIAVVQMNNELRQLENEENREIEKILRHFSEKIREKHDMILQTLMGLAQLDFIMAKANYAFDINGVKPIINERGVINIIQGRHPLLGEKAVPLDIILGDKFNVLIITGPNTGGKTVSLKTVGLFVLMAQSGLLIPAKEGTQLPIFKEVFADIGDEQSIEQSLSTFSSHMKNIKEIIDSATNESLIILDELGAGTDPMEGSALAMAILNYLYEKGSKVLASTHYSELKSFAFSRKGMENASMEFDVNTLSPTYKLTIGIPGRSNAFEIARRLGVKDEILKQGKSFMQEEALKMEDLLLDIERQRQKVLQERKSLESIKAEYLKKLDKLEMENNKIKKKQERIIQKAKEEARNLLEEVKRESRHIIESLKKAQNQNRMQIKDRAIQQAREWLKKADFKMEDKKKDLILTRSNKNPEKLKLGQKVQIGGLSQQGYILAFDETSKTAQIQVGIMKINVPISSLIPVEDREEEGENLKFSNLAMSKAKEFSTELDIRGLTVDEALIKVDNYLDDAVLAGVSKVKLIHGKGTGALRQSISDMLRKRPNVKSFRLGNIDEGGTGVTVVEL